MSHPAQQLSAIHAMLATGHRNLRVERHSLILWGLAAGGLFALSNSILTPDDFPDLEQRALAWLALLVAVLGGVVAADWWLTPRVKAARDEAWSFIHRQVQKVWWLLMGMATLLTFATFFFGGGYMVCAVWLAAIGISLYVHGLFSEELLEWIGALIIVIAIACLAARLSYESMRWIAASVFAIGLPLLAALLDGGRHRSALVRLGQTVGWLLVVLLPPLVGQRYAEAGPLPGTPVLTLEEFRRSAGDGSRIVSLPAGTQVPVEIELAGDLFTNAGPAPTLPLTLAEPVEVLLENGQLTGDARFPGDAWQQSRDVRWISIPWMKAELTPDRGPLIRGRLEVHFRSK